MTPKHLQRLVKDILELSSNPTQEEIKTNYKRLVKQYHPDINKDPHAEEAIKLINKAYDIATGKVKVVMPPPPPQPRQGIIITWVNGTTTNTGTWWY